MGMILWRKAHAVALAARLKETAFARDTAEKSLELLEGKVLPGE